MTKLERRQHLAARVLAVGGSNEIAAHVAGRSARTIRRWKSDPEFVAIVESLGLFALPPEEVARSLGMRPSEPDEDPRRGRARTVQDGAAQEPAMSEA